MNGDHVPVLLAEVLELLAPRAGERVLDGTVGGGGHARALLEQVSPGGRLIGLDRDASALQRAAGLLPVGQPDRCVLRQANYVDFAGVLDELGERTVDVALLDLGVSSFQLDQAERGFSFQQDGPLDMRMDASGGPTAADLVNELAEEDLADIFYKYGEERFSRRIAARIVQARRQEPITSTGQLARLVLSARPGKARGQWQRIHPATRVFQSLRIYLNRELESLETFCRTIADRLSPGGRLGIISFHSLEDRIVKQSFKQSASDGVFERVTRKPVTATDEERQRNARSRSAKLRVVCRRGAENTSKETSAPERFSRHGGGERRQG